MIRCPLAIAVLLLLPVPASAADVFKCVTENGVVRYSSTPCQDGQAEKLAIESEPTDAAAVRSRVEERQERIEALNETEAAAREDAAKAAQKKQERETACAQARERQQKMMTERLMYSGEGEDRKYLSSEEIVQRRQEMQAQVAELCGG